MPVYMFEMTEVKKLYDHAKACKDHRLAYGQEGKAEAGFWLVKDAGAYLMSNGQPGQARGQNCVYAEGCRPEDGHIGGDDYVENVPGGWYDLAKKARQAYLTIKITEDQFELVLPKKKGKNGPA